MGEILIELTDEDWKDFCQIMGSLTWGRGPTMDLWHALRERIESRKMRKVKQEESS